MNLSTYEGHDEEVPLVRECSTSDFDKQTCDINSDLKSSLARCPHARYGHPKTALLLSVLLLGNIILFAMNWSHDRSRDCFLKTNTTETYSLADEAIEYEFRDIDVHASPSPYSGKPRPEFDAAWKTLLYYTNIEVTGDELKAMNQTSLKLEGSGNYLAYLEVYHQLHCVKRMVQTRYPEHYPDLVAKGKLSDEHFDHCVDVLRESIMCRADTSIVTLKWDESSPEKASANAHGPRKCASWERLVQWGSQRFAGTRFKFATVDGIGISGPDPGE